jgi:hypothetical protein
MQTVKNPEIVFNGTGMTNEELVKFIQSLPVEIEVEYEEGRRPGITSINWIEGGLRRVSLPIVNINARGKIVCFVDPVGKQELAYDSRNSRITGLFLKCLSPTENGAELAFLGITVSALTLEVSFRYRSFDIAIIV